ncbi:hypothetical protein AVEN_5661-1, partial [Araneus ventricosus]
MSSHRKHQNSPTAHGEMKNRRGKDILFSIEFRDGKAVFSQAQ